MWNIFPLDNDPQKYKVSHRDRPTVKNECEYTKTTRKHPREDFILTKKTKVRNRQTKTLTKGSSLKTGTFKSCRPKPVL